MEVKEKTHTKKGLIVLLILLLLWFGLCQLAQYGLDMQYSGLAPSQVNDETIAYKALQLQGTLNNVLSLIRIVGAIAFIILIIRKVAKINWE